MQKPHEILEKEALKICALSLEREVTLEHTEVGKMGPGRANPHVQN